MSESYSPGLEGIVAGETAVSTVETGLTYRGYTIEDLGANSNYEEVAYLVLYGELPTAEQAAAFRQRLGQAAKIPPELLQTLASIPPAASTMDVLRSSASLLAHWEPEVNDNSHDANVRKSERLLAQMPVVVAARQRLKEGKSVIAADPKLTLPANFLWMLRGEKPSERQVKALDVSFILYAEHEFNASAFSARCVVSTLSDLHSGITAAIGALKGPLHGGAPGPALQTVFEIGEAARAEAVLRAKLARGERLMGFGHRIYRVRDPRAVVLQQAADQLYATDGDPRIYRLAQHVERTALALLAEHKPGARLQTNVEYYTALLLHGLGFDQELFTPTFAIARVGGWTAHCLEQLAHNRIFRPQSAYVGATGRSWRAGAA